MGINTDLTSVLSWNRLVIVGQTPGGKIIRRRCRGSHGAVFGNVDNVMEEYAVMRSDVLFGWSW
jgi:hypothetical protein